MCGLHRGGVKTAQFMNCSNLSATRFDSLASHDYDEVKSIFPRRHHSDLDPPVAVLAFAPT